MLFIVVVVVTAEVCLFYFLSLKENKITNLRLQPMLHKAQRPVTKNVSFSF